MTIHNSLAELIGNTPLVKLNHIPQAAGVKAPSPSKSNTSTPADPPRTASPNASSTPPKSPAN